jgi:transcriptional regulator with XRE-family HTH domain
MLLHVMQQSEAATFGQVLKYWRTQAGLSLRDVEATTQMSATNLSRIERGLIGPPPNFVLDKLAAAVGVERSVLYSAAGRLPPDDEAGKQGVVEAVMADPDLTEDQKWYLIEGFRLLRERNRPAQEQ